jgi:hypothetical protein
MAVCAEAYMDIMATIFNVVFPEHGCVSIRGTVSRFVGEGMSCLRRLVMKMGTSKKGITQIQCYISIQRINEQKLNSLTCGIYIYWLSVFDIHQRACIQIATRLSVILEKYAEFSVANREYYASDVLLSICHFMVCTSQLRSDSYVTFTDISDKAVKDICVVTTSARLENISAVCFWNEQDEDNLSEFR